jgi:probable HAF family extracellular repeat protein
MRRALTSVLAALALGGATAAGQTAAVEYTVTELGTLGGTMAEAWGINNAGQIVGRAFLPGDLQYHAFLYQNGIMIDLGTIGANCETGHSWAFDINEVGQIAGRTCSHGIGTRAFLWTAGHMADLGTLGGTGSEARAINNAGDVVGTAAGPNDGWTRPFLFRNGLMQDLGSLVGPGWSGEAFKINDSGQVVGFGDVSATPRFAHAFFYGDSAMTDLTPGIGQQSIAWGLNEAGKAVGIWNDRAFRYLDGSMTVLGMLAGRQTVAQAVNNHDQIVGYGAVADHHWHAFVIENGAMVDLNDRIPGNPGWDLNFVTDINDSGQIVGIGTLDDRVRAFLLTPVSNPAMAIDAPTGTVGTTFTASGWAIDQGAPTGTGVTAIHIYATPSGGTQQFVGVAAYGNARSDIGSIFGSRFTNSGWALGGISLAPGSYTLTAYAFSTVTGSFSIARQAAIAVAGPISDPVMMLDGPADNTAVGQTFTVSGWAVDLNAPAGPGTDAVHVYLFPSGGAHIFLGVAARKSRPDVASVFGPHFLNSGYELNVAGTPLPVGAAQLVVFARSTLTGTFNHAVSVAITVNATSSNPAMFIDQPANGAVIGASLSVSGWSIDRGAPAGTGVNAIHVWALPTSGAPGTFLGVATYGLPRPDIGSLFGAPFTNSGYALTADTSALPPNRYYIVVFSYSTVTNSFSFAAAVVGTKM